MRLASFALIPGVSCNAVMFALVVSALCSVVPVPPSVCLFITLAELFFGLCAADGVDFASLHVGAWCFFHVPGSVGMSHVWH